MEGRGKKCSVPTWLPVQWSLQGTGRGPKTHPLPLPTLHCHPRQSRVVWPQKTSAWPWSCRKLSSVGSTSTPTGFLEPLWDSGTTTAARSIFFYPNWFKLETMLKSTGTRFVWPPSQMHQVLPLSLMQAKRWEYRFYFSLRLKMNCTVPKDVGYCSMSWLATWKRVWTGKIYKWHNVIWQSKQNSETRWWKTFIQT